MKSILSTITVIVCLLFYTDVYSQTELWGMTSEGGGVKGIIFKTDSSGNNLSVEYIFENFEQNPRGSLLKASNGKYYGLSENGGLNGLGTIFEYDAGTDSLIVLHDFDGTATGAHPKGSLIQASNGKLYGLTRDGGNVSVGRGVLFEYDISDGTITKRHDFTDGPTGAHPEGSLMEASNGKLYGTTAYGGSGSGTIFEYDISADTLIKLYNLVSTYGANPLGELVEASNGKLYGLASAGGVAGYGGNGILFEWDIPTGTYRMVHDFDGTLGNATGSNPRGSLVEASNGELYGMTYGGGAGAGVIFEYDVDNDTVIKRYDFQWGDSGNAPNHNNLVEGATGNLFGMTNRGGTNDDGVIFEFNFNSGTYTKLYDLSVPPNGGNNTFGSLIESTPGKFMGMTYYGGATNKGTLFEFDTTSRSTYTILHHFDSYSKGQKPYGSLCAASNSKLYGVTSQGGGYNAGTLFEYDPFSGTLVKKHDFGSANTGSGPTGSLIQAANGKLYGMAKYGGSNSWGTLFEFDPVSGSLTVKHHFANTTGAWPCGSLLEASNGKLYGLTSYGGQYNNWGTLFEYDITGDNYSVKVNFQSSVNGRNPEGSLIETSPGLLYGLTFAGGTVDAGVLFEYDIAGDTIYVKHQFDNTTEGREPKGDLIDATNGKLYGMTSNGSTNSMGTIFKYDPGTGTFTTIHTFNPATTGKNPYGSLRESTDGNIYGMTGGSTDPIYYGTFFRLDTNTNTVTKLFDFDKTNGSKPQYTQLIVMPVHADWTGAVSTDWNDPGNWLQNIVPDPFTDVTIPDVSGASGNFPVVNSDCRVRNLTIDLNAYITIPDGVNIIVGRE